MAAQRAALSTGELAVTAALETATPWRERSRHEGSCAGADLRILVQNRSAWWKIKRTLQKLIAAPQRIICTKEYKETECWQATGKVLVRIRQITCRTAAGNLNHSAWCDQQCVVIRQILERDELISSMIPTLSLSLSLSLSLPLSALSLPKTFRPQQRTISNLPLPC